MAISIGAIAKKTQLTPRTIRYYESIGLLPKAQRGENNYRLYPSECLSRIQQIRSYKELGFSLDEIKKLLMDSTDGHSKLYEHKTQETVAQLRELQSRRKKLAKTSAVQATQTIGYKNIEFLSGVQNVLNFAKENHLFLGSPRGKSSASYELFAAGLSPVDPIKYNFISERVDGQRPYYHIDVEYSRGQDFVEFCQLINQNLRYGEIQAFKLPILSIIRNTHEKIGGPLNYNQIADDSDLVLKPFRNLDFEKIFGFDSSPHSLSAKLDRSPAEYFGTEKVKDHFLGQTNFSFRDLLNFAALYRPADLEMRKKIETYKGAKKKPLSLAGISEASKQLLESNHGMIIFHEDLIRIIAQETGWDLRRSNQLQLTFRSPENQWTEAQRTEVKTFRALVADETFQLLKHEANWSYCQPHGICFFQFTKMSAVLKSLHREIYLAEVDRFEQTYGVCWDDIGYRIKGLSLHQLA